MPRSRGGHGVGQRLGLGEQFGLDLGWYGRDGDQPHDDRSGHDDDGDGPDRHATQGDSESGTTEDPTSSTSSTTAPLPECTMDGECGDAAARLLCR
jgi:hypothetical protein